MTLCQMLDCNSFINRTRTPYDDGMRYCSHCRIYQFTDVLRCVCCKGQLRLSPKANRKKEIQN